MVKPKNENSIKEMHTKLKDRTKREKYEKLAKNDPAETQHAQKANTKQETKQHSKQETKHSGKNMLTGRDERIKENEPVNDPDIQTYASNSYRLHARKERVHPPMPAHRPNHHQVSGRGRGK